jgi:DHA1 family bicyclomycin/chloramphenicol resistance-like MFS transporter
MSAAATSRPTYIPTYTLGWLFILAAIVAIGPFSIDMYLPSLPALQRHFSADAAATQLTLSAYFVGLALGQIIYGPVSDRFGRKKPMLVGLGVYVAASLGCALAPSMDSLIGLRFAQALGGSAGMVLTRAIVRDRYPDDMARILSALLLIMGVAPIIAPLLGGQMLLFFGWQAIFVALVVFGSLCFLAVLLGIRETSPGGAALDFASVSSTYARLLSHRRFMGYALVGGVAQGGMFAYISGSPFVFIEVYGVPAGSYGWLFGINAFGLIAGSQINSRLLQRFHSERIIKGAIRINAICGALVLASAITGFGGLTGIMIPLFGCTTSLGFTFPNSTAAAMAPFGDRAGTASALLGTLQFTVAAITSAVVGHLYNGTAVPMAAVIAACGCSSLLLFRVLISSRAHAATGPKE